MNKLYYYFPPPSEWLEMPLICPTKSRIVGEPYTIFDSIFFETTHGYSLDDLCLILTDRQKEVLQMKVNGLTFREIGEILGISKQTAHESYQSTLKKIGSLSYKFRDTPLPYIDKNKLRCEKNKIRKSRKQEKSLKSKYYQYCKFFSAMQKKVFEGYYFEKKSLRTIGEELNIHFTTVNEHLKSAKQKLIEMM
jgi:DNA-binding CsgD family transcriptional regulator